MPMKTPRLPPLKDSELTEAQEAIIAPFRAVKADFNVARTLGRHPRMLTAFRTWATYVMMEPNKLEEREREIMALRTAWRIQSDYVWSRHLSYAAKAKLTDAEVVALKRPLGDHPWGPADLALVKAADALCADFFIPDDIWAELIKYFDEEQLIDAIFVVGHFCMMGMFLNVAGTPLDPDVPYDADLDRFS